MLGLAGLLLGLGAALGGAGVPPLLVAAGVLEQLPAVWAVGAVAALAYGVWPRAAVPLAWGAWLYVNLFGEVLGPTLGLGYEASNRLVPFAYLPRIVSGGTFQATPLLALVLLAALLMGAGLLGLRGRDVD